MDEGLTLEITQSQADSLLIILYIQKGQLYDHIPILVETMEKFKAETPEQLQNYQRLVDNLALSRVLENDIAEMIEQLAQLMDENTLIKKKQSKIISPGWSSPDLSS